MHGPLELFPSLRQRLLSCMFKPQIFAPHAVFWFSTWMLYFLFQDETASLSSTASLAAAGATLVTTTATATATMTATTTKTIAYTSSVETEAAGANITSAVETFLSLKANDSARQVATYIEGFNENCKLKLRLWNASLETQLGFWEREYESLKAYNNTIFSNLLEQAQTINSSVDYLSNSGFLVASDSQSSVLRGLSLNTSFLQSVFGNVSSNLGKIRNLTLPAAPTATASALSASEILDSITSNKTTSNFTSMLGVLGSDKKIRTTLLVKRDSASDTSGKYKQKAIRISSALAATYVAATFAFVCLEYVTYKIEVRGAQDTLQHQLECIDELYKGETVISVARIRAHESFQQLLICYNDFAKHPVTYTFTEMALELLRRPLSKTWSPVAVAKFVKAYNWWLTTNGLHVFCLFLAAVVEGQILRAFLDVSHSTHPTSLYPRSKFSEAALSTKTLGSISSSCALFESTVNAEINSVVHERLWNASRGNVTQINSLLDEYFSNVNATLKDQVPAIDMNMSYWSSELNSEQTFNFTSFSETLAHEIYEVVAPSENLETKRLVRRSEAAQSQAMGKTILARYEKGCLCLLGSVVFYLLCGFLAAAV
ncbi:pheromone-regulated protein PRM2 [Lachancea thermotolerans CBS 6340]|uniref:KLTH0A03630p n=1 Tax=Lachancea thermotolerans (strain ATCC 56472 / CBS 6340 / NRRL Y-8284) TaxID=559295 RepID=C5DBL7_LACTC|nr:KLTH0A03630p [Lachancea thermotolerans CBS 6340]CAR21174.1 KLTH0A03630p [Lachancea thermotolerans CBS 6340]